MSVYFNDKKFVEHYYQIEEDFERDLLERSKLLFGKDTILINSKKKIDTQSFGGAIPDAILFDFSDPHSPEFYLIEIEIKAHDFFRHIFPQITKFFAFFKNQKSQRELIDKLYQVVSSDDDLRNGFKKYIGDKEIYKTIGDVILNSQNILLIIDGAKEELPEITQTYTDTWGKIVKAVIVRRFDNKQDHILTMEPDFESIEDIEEYDAKTNIALGNYDEDYHIEGISSENRDLYLTLKAKIFEIDNKLSINPQKYYISIKYDRNILFLKIRKKKIRLIILLPYEHVAEKIQHYPVKQLSQSVQDFYNGSCCAIDIENAINIQEIIELISEKVRLTISST